MSARRQSRAARGCVDLIGIGALGEYETEITVALRKRTDRLAERNRARAGRSAARRGSGRDASERPRCLLGKPGRSGENLRRQRRVRDEKGLLEGRSSGVSKIAVTPRTPPVRPSMLSSRPGTYPSGRIVCPPLPPFSSRTERISFRDRHCRLIVGADHAATGARPRARAMLAAPRRPVPTAVAGSTCRPRRPRHPACYPSAARRRCCRSRGRAPAGWPRARNRWPGRRSAVPGARHACPCSSMEGPSSLATSDWNTAVAAAIPEANKMHSPPSSITSMRSACS